MTVYSWVSRPNQVSAISFGSGTTINFGGYADLLASEINYMQNAGYGVTPGQQGVPPTYDPTQDIITKDELDAALGSVGSARGLGISRVEVRGHSYGAGYLLGSPGTNRATAKLAAALGATEVNGAVIGSQAIHDTISQGGWVNVLSNITRNRQSPPDLPYSQMAVVWYGVNDIPVIPPAKRARYLGHALRAIISSFIQSRRYEQDHASITYGGSWTDITGVADYASGGSSKKTTSNGATVTISVPSNFPGGTIALGMACGSAETGIFTATLDGSIAGSADVSDAFTVNGSSNVFPVMIRLTGISAGAHTIVITTSSVSGALYFDYWAMELPAALSPLVMLPSQPKIGSLGYAQYASKAYPIADADITAMNTIISGVVAEYASQRVRYVDHSILDYGLIPGAWIASDQLHWNELGHGKSAGLIIASATASGYTAADAALATQ